MPGAIILWAQYIFPSRGNILVSRRRAENRILQVLLTLSVYCAALGALIYLLFKRQMFHCLCLLVRSFPNLR